MKIHIVQKGDTLWKIAKKYGVNFEELKKMNSQLSNPDMIMPGMKVKVATTGGMIKKETPMGQKPNAGVNLGVKKEMPIAEHPFAKEQPKPMPIVEAPIKEAPKAPYTPKMPIIPEIDINNYYMMNMANMTVKEAPQLPPAPVKVLPPIKEVPKQEVPIVEAPYCPPPMEQPICEPICEPVCEPECVPISPVMPGTGFCPPVDPVMPYPAAAGVGMPITHGVFPGAGMPMNPGAELGVGVPMSTGAAPAAYVPPYFEDESSSSFMPQMPAAAPGFAPGGVGGPAGIPMQSPYMQPGVSQPPLSYPPPASYQGYPVPGGYYPPETYQEFQGGYPAGYPGFQGGYPVYPSAYAGPSSGYVAPAPGYVTGPYQGFREMPNHYDPGSYPGYRGEYQSSEQTIAKTEYPNSGYGNPGAVPPYGQMPYGYPPAGYGSSNENEALPSAAGAQPIPAQSGQLPVGTGRLNDCGCGGQAGPPQAFVPTTPPVYTAPYTAPPTVAHPPFMNPYGMGPMGTAPYGMPRDDDESDERGS